LAGVFALAGAFAGGRFGAAVDVDEFAGFELAGAALAGAALAGAFLADVADFFTAGAGFVDFFAAAIARPPPWAQIERRNIAAPSRDQVAVRRRSCRAAVRTTRGR
jgi:hypothetical protein